MWKFSLRAVKVVVELTFTVRESRETKKLDALPSILKLSTLLSETTIGRTLKLCGQMGVITKFPEPGKTMGPPQLNEYAVDPVGVATIKPSAQYEFKNSPFI